MSPLVSPNVEGHNLDVRAGRQRRLVEVAPMRPKPLMPTVGTLHSLQLWNRL
jgi:hypothetical protein